MSEKKFQVFVSSTYTDLVEERERIIKAILEMYHIPIGMEMFSAEDEDQWEIIRRTIEISDYYILILGLRYGSKAEDDVSFTEKEYEYALEKGIPILAFILDDSVSLSKDRRDDNLLKINSFRAKVLKNSKMSQFWKTIDELTKNVSISLMKQIMQKPGVGWVRGDKAISEELSQELTSLSKENRELRESIKELESKIHPKAPIIELSINCPVVDNKFNAYNRVDLPEYININNIDEHLKVHITEEEIQNFNDNIPSQSQLDIYNEKYEKFYKQKNYSSGLALKVCNAGTVKANNIYIDIKFPDEFLVIDKDNENKEPKNPIPYSPIRWAQTRYEKSFEEKKNSALKSTLHNRIYGSISAVSPSFNMPKIRPINQSWWTSLNENQLTIKINSLLHTRCMNFDDEFIIVPLKTGKHSVEVSVICEEFETEEKTTIELNVTE